MTYTSTGLHVLMIRHRFHQCLWVDLLSQEGLSPLVPFGAGLLIYERLEGLECRRTRRHSHIIPIGVQPLTPSLPSKLKTALFKQSMLLINPHFCKWSFCR